MKGLRSTTTVIAASALLGFFGSAEGADVTVVTTCGQVVTGTGELQADLDCSTYEGVAVTVTRGALHLNGFTVTGNAARVGEPGDCSVGVVVACDSSNCTIEGPGTVTGGAVPTCNVGAVAFFRKVLSVSSTGNAGSGVSHAKRIDGSTITGNGRHGVEIGNVATTLRDSVVSGNGGRGIQGVGAKRAKLIGTTVSGNQGQGVFFGDAGKGRAMLRGSDVSGNALAPLACEAEYPGIACADIVGPLPPRVDDASTCGTSADGATGQTFGVCAGD